MEHNLFGMKFDEFIEVEPEVQHCVYLLLCDNEIVYAGKTGNLAKRIAEHRRGSKVFDAIRYYNVESESASTRLENEIIKTLEPKFNMHSTSRHCRNAMETRATGDERARMDAERNYEKATEIHSLPLPIRVKHGLIASGFMTIDSIRNATYADIVCVRNVSVKTADKILAMVGAVE